MGDPKELGNKFFFERKYEQALDCYSEAIVSVQIIFICSGPTVTLIQAAQAIDSSSRY